MHGLRHKTIPTWDAMVTAFLRRFFYIYILKRNHGRIQILNQCWIHRKWSGRRGAVRNIKGQREDEAWRCWKPRWIWRSLHILLLRHLFWFNKFWKSRLCWIRNTWLLIQKMDGTCLISPWIPNPSHFFRPEMTHWLIWCIFNKSVG